MNLLMQYIGKLLAFVGSMFSAPPMQPWDGRRALIRWDNRDVWTIEESYEGMQVWGDIGSGKSSTIARVTAAAMLRAGYGGLVLTVKPEDTDEWRRNLAAADSGIHRFRPGEALRSGKRGLHPVDSIRNRCSRDPGSSWKRRPPLANPPRVQIEPFPGRVPLP